MNQVSTDTDVRRHPLWMNPSQFEMSIQAEDLSGYVPTLDWELAPPSEAQLKALERYGIFPDEIDNAGKASKLLDRLKMRSEMGLTTPKQIRFLERKGFRRVGTWRNADAKNMIDRYAALGWRQTPPGVNPATYTPPTPAFQPYGEGW